MIAALIKMAVTAGLIWWLSLTIDLQELHRSLGGVSHLALVLAAAILVLQALVVAWRWHRIVRMLCGHLSVRKSVQWVFVGLFFNQALPTSVGGDAIRIWSLHRSGTAPGLAFTSVAVERATGLAALGIVISLCALVYGRALSPGTMAALVVSGPLLVAVLIALARLDGLAAKWLPASISTHVDNLARGLRTLARSSRYLVEIGALGIAAQCLIIAAAYVLGHGLGIDVPFGVYVLIVGGAILLSLLPVSLGGWGLREAGMVVLAGAFGLPPAPVVALSVTWALLPLLLSLPFGFHWLLGNHPRAAEVRGSLTAPRPEDTA